MRRIITSMLALAVLLGLAGTMPVTATADTGQSCAQELNLSRPSSTDAAAKTPVILVHGLWSKAAMWVDAGMTTALASVDGLAVVKPFDYKSANSRWVTEGGTDQRLAKTIVCYSKLYGGKKVIIVVHSMGGLLTRAALDWAAYGTFAKKVVGHIVTIGTPHEGANISDASYIANISLCNAAFFWWGKDAQQNCSTVEEGKAVSAMRPGSPELAALPHIPSGITVRAIAGDVKAPPVCTPWSCALVDSNSDLVVPVSSATDEYTSTGVGDGKKVYTCTGLNWFESMSQAWCSHSSLTKSPSVQADVKASIQAYLASLQPKKLPLPPHRMESSFFTRLKVPYLNTWIGAMSEPNSVMNVVDDTNCSDDNADCPHIYFIDLISQYGEATYGDDPVAVAAAQLCSTDEQQATGSMKQVAARSVGGAPAQYYEQAHCSTGKEVSEYVWYVPSRHLLVTAHDAPSGKLNLSGLRAVLDNVEWNS